MSSVSDERGQELQYAGIPISKIFEDNMGIGGVLSLLWFQKRLPEYAGKFFEMCLMITGDHGPAVSGAHNTIVCARAGKDLVSSLTSGLLTIVSNTVWGELGEKWGEVEGELGGGLRERVSTNDVIDTLLPRIG